MKKDQRVWWGSIGMSLTLGLSGMLSMMSPISAFAATSPSLGTAASFSVLAHTTVTDVPTSSISGDVGLDNGTGGSAYGAGLTSAQVAGTIYATDANGPDGAAGNNPGLLGTAMVDSTAAYGLLSTGTNADANCVGGVLADNTDLSTLSPLGPGVYCTAGRFRITGALVLTGTTGTWVFRAGSTLITSPGATVTGGDPCNIWWGVGSSATLDTTTTFEGNILALASIGMNTGAILNGRALVQTGAVTLDSNTISGPVCAATAASGTSISTGSINVVKTVINDNGGTKVVSDFPLFINDIGVVSGATTSYSFYSSGPYYVTETADPNYAASYSGDCDATGMVYLHAGENKFCIITNNDIGAPVVAPPVPPLIDVVKVPSPLALPDGPGSVTYTYTLRNIGTVPVTDVTMVGDTCSPIVLQSGDTNNDQILDLTETWVHTCTTTLSATHTNTVVATGWANGLSATDIASATVVVGTPLVPPLIHLTKIPSPLTLLAGGGTVAYVVTVTNPGTVAINSVTVTDDKCSPMAYGSGDTNGDSKLDPSESWVYTCSANLTESTTNTASVTGEANGYTVRDLALATVVVAAAAPAMPSTGFAPATAMPILGILVALLAISLVLIVMRRKQA